MKKLTYVLILVLLFINTPAFAQETHEITSFSPATIIPSETVLTITGTGFFDTFNSTENAVCFGQSCYVGAADLSDYLQLWSDTEVQILVPEDIGTNSAKIKLRVYLGEEEGFDYIESAEEYTVEIPSDPEISSFSPTEITPGETVVTISGTSFGDSFTPANQVCFGLDQCMTSENSGTYLQNWSDSEIQILVLESVTEPSKITVWAYSWNSGAYIQVESENQFTITEEVVPPDELPPEDNPPEVTPPEISSFSPTLLTPGETTLTISGTNFGESYVEGYNQICFEGNGCVTNEDIATYLINWSNTEIQILVPAWVTTSGKIGLMLQNPATGEYGMTYSSENFTLPKPPAQPDPEITSISPTALVAGDTVITITGYGFGDSFQSGYNQICFNEYCILDDNIPFYLQSWSDTKITLSTPSWLTDESGTIGLRVYFPSTGLYNFIESPSFTTKKRPIIEWYYLKMDQGGTYAYSGYNFGNSPGKVVIEGMKCGIEEWNDLNITFMVPQNAPAGNGKLYIENSEGIKSQELNIIIQSVETYSNDEYSRYQWYLKTVNAENAWGITEGSKDVIVAVIDSGVDINHEDLKHAIWTNTDETPNNGIDDDNNGYIDDIHGWDFVLNTNSMEPRSAHGTMVSGMIAGKKDNGVGIAGIAPNVTIMPLNVAADELYIDVDAALYSIKYAVDNGADIINLSFGGIGASSYYEDIIQYAYDNNVLITAATGNESTNIDSYDYAPVCIDLDINAILGIAATNESNTLAWFSNYGSRCTDLSAPGENIILSLPSNIYEIGMGTSFSSPLTAGIAALVKSEHPDWNVEEIKQVLLDTAMNIDDLNSSYNGELGAGIPDAYAALTASKPDVAYNYNPGIEVEIEETNETIEVAPPETTPIQEPEPIKDDTIEKDTTNKDTDQSQGTNITPAFPDIKGYEYEKAIESLKNAGIINGYPDGTFKPDDFINRAEFTKILINAFVANISGGYCFPDVKDEWFAPYVCTAKILTIVNGYPDNTFKPANQINVVEALKIILETSGAEFYSTPGDDWFAPYIAYALNTNLDFILYKKSFGENVTRGEMAEMIYRFFP